MEEIFQIASAGAPFLKGKSAKKDTLGSRGELEIEIVKKLSESIQAWKMGTL